MPSLGPLKRPLRILRRHLPPFNFITLHYIYFILACLLTALIFWGSSTPFQKISFTDSLFLTVSAMTLAGLNTVNMSELNTFQQFLLFLLIMLGSVVFVSAFVVHVRRKAFEKKFEFIEERWKGPLGRVKTWASSAVKKRSGDTTGDDEEAPVEAKGVEDDKVDDKSVSHELSRDPTPPERRGGPEMNEDSHSEITNADTNGAAISTSRSENPGISFREDTRFAPTRQTVTQTSQSMPPIKHHRSGIFSLQGVGARPMSSLRPTTTLDMQAYPSLQRADTSVLGRGRRDISRYFESATGWISRNSQFHGLSDAEREKLGGCEYRAVSLLEWLVPLYFILWQLIGCIGCGAWVKLNKHDTARTNGLSPFWVGAFNAVSAFNNSGMSLLDANMVAFQRSYYMLLTMGLLILAGNTAYPVFLRLIVWCLYRLCGRFSRYREDSDPWSERTRTLKFLLDHPRRCYTNLFPSQPTWWLALSVIALNGVDWAAFEILNIGNTQLSDDLATRYRVIDGLFQAFAVRSGGFYVVTISALRISLQVLYVVMMYVSVYPVVISMRNSNVYEERSLGIYADDEGGENENEQKDSSDEEKQQQQEKPNNAPWLKRAKTIKNHFVNGSTAAATHESNGHFVRQQLRAQLAHDAWWIVLSLFLIMIIEASKFDAQPAVYSAFNFIFEIVSAYGCVGISVGVPWASYSFCGSWSTLSKLILCAVMLRGRHRGLPVAIDKAVLLPGEGLAAAEEEDGRIRRAKTMALGGQEGGV